MSTRTHTGRNTRQNVNDFFHKKGKKAEKKSDVTLGCVWRGTEVPLKGDVAGAGKAAANAAARVTQTGSARRVHERKY